MLIAVKSRSLAVAYLRTSSAANVGADKDSHIRQMTAIQEFGDRTGFEIVLPPYYDAAVSGADSVDSRRGFRQMMTYLGEHPEVRTILVETANRFARDLIVQETGYRMLKERGIDLIAADSPDGFLGESPTAELIRQVLGAVSQFEKSMTVAKLRAARERKRATHGKCEGRKSYRELSPEMVKFAKRLRRKNPKTGGHRSLREIARLLAESGYLNEKGHMYGPSQVKAMLAPDIGKQSRTTRAA